MNWPPDYEITEDFVYSDYLRLAYRFGFDNAIDDSTRNGALIMDPSTGEILVYGCCGLPEELKDRLDLLVGPLKYDHVKHAERDAINTFEKKNQTSLSGMEMICPWYACPPCAERIRDVGIEAVIGHEETFLRTPDRWQEPIIQGFEILHDAGVRTLVYRGEIGGVQALLNRKLWHP